ncbi:hypothetical protein Agub_g9208 [Astrephomene gubernaculifera]|uniref:N-alpha-acetyltransferase 60 n=1 Tax=Astrephomene gubernaculifera TaxID=47775 RepID=A0AAD3HN30_9CHLO|nr:hypothetical protein Agub_g9208 [Astrephomene gubernaculifera]
MIGHHVAVSGPGTTALYQGEPPLNLYYRPLQQNDYNALKAIHRDLFPIDYEEVFFQKAVSGEDRVFSWAAVHSQNGRDHLVGFVTARLVYMHECDPVDRQVMGLSSRSLDGCCGCYVLTLGVVPSCRQCGIARCLLGLVQQHAARLRCRAIFLHVISYNIGAMRLYGGAGYQAMARLPNFYHLLTGRQPDPSQTWFDAFLYALFLPPGGVLGAGGGSGEVSPALQWAGGVIGAAVAPLRSVLGTFQGCVPAWLSRQTYSTFLPFAASAAALTSCKDQPRGAPPTPNGQRHQQQPLHQQWPLSAGPYPYMQQQQHVSQDPGAACLPYSPAGPQHPHQHPPQQQQLQQQQQRYSQECGPVSSQGWVPAGGNRRDYEAHPQAPNWPQALPWEQQGPGEAALPMPGPMQGGPMQQQQPAGEGYGPVLRPPSPLAPPSHAGRCATPQQQPPQQQAYPAAAGGGFGEAGVMPTYTAAGPGYCHPHPYQVQQQQQQPPPQQQYNDFRQRHGHGLSRSNSRNSYQHQKHPQQQQHQHQQHPSGEDGNGSAQGDLECSSRSSSGAHRNPQGLGGSGLHMRPQQHQQQQQQQHNQRQRQSGSLLTSLLRPPAAQPHPHRR